MASIRKEVLIDVSPEDAWDALRDWGAIHERLAPGFVTDCRIEDGDRLLTFFNGAEAREVLVDLDDELRRIAWSVQGGPYSHHNGAAWIVPTEGGGTKFVWVADLLPDELAEPTDQMMEAGCAAIKKTLGPDAA